MEQKLYFQMLRRGWWIVSLTALIALAVSLGAAYLATPQYKAIARFIVTPGTRLIEGSDVLNSLDTLDRQSVISTYNEVMNSSRIYNDALASLQLQPTIDLEVYSYEAVVAANSSVLELTVSGPDAKLAAELANAIGYQTINFTRQLNQVYNVEFLDLAVPPVVPFSPNLPLIAGLAITLGLVFGVVIAISSEQLRISLESFGQRFNMDAVSGVYNNRYFSRLVEERLAQNPEDLLSIGILELHGIRDLIETIPIVVLQKVFRETTDVLRRELRGNDMVGRWNDNSFIIMLPNTPAMAATRIFERIYQALSEPIDLGNMFDTVVNLDPRIGGAEYSNKISKQELYEKAEDALGKAQRDTVNHIYVWEIKSPFWAQNNGVTE